MSEKTLKSGDFVVSKKKFHASKQPIALNLVGRGKIVISDRLSTMIVVLNILLAFLMIISLDLHVLYCLK